MNIIIALLPAIGLDRQQGAKQQAGQPDLRRRHGGDYCRHHRDFNPASGHFHASFLPVPSVRCFIDDRSNRPVHLLHPDRGQQDHAVLNWPAAGRQYHHRGFDLW